MSLYFPVAVVWDGWADPVLLVIEDADVVLVPLHNPMSWFDDSDGDPDRVLVSWVWVAWTPVEGRGFDPDRYDVNRADSIVVHGCCLSRSVFGIGPVGGEWDLDPTIARCPGHPSRLLWLGCPARRFALDVLSVLVWMGHSDCQPCLL